MSLSYAAPTESAITIVSPSTKEITTKDMLVSLRISEARALTLSVEEILEEPEENKVIVEPIEIETNSNLNIYTEKVTGLKPGKYMIIVEDADTGDVVIEHKITVKEKQNTTSGSIFSPPAQNNGTLQTIQTVIKNIFGGSEK
jgi:hypothetical protein